MKRSAGFAIWWDELSPEKQAEQPIHQAYKRWRIYLPSARIVDDFLIDRVPGVLQMPYSTNLPAFTQDILLNIVVRSIGL